MIEEIRAKNTFSFNEPIVFSLKADMRNKKFPANVHEENSFKVLKVAGIYGPNNAGKTCLIQCIKSIKEVILDQPTISLRANLFSKDPVCVLGVTFLNDGHEYSYDFRYNPESKEYDYEKFSEILIDKYGNEKEENWLLVDHKTNNYYSDDTELQKMIAIVAKNNLLMYLIDTNKFEHLKRMKQILVSFAEKIDIIDMNNIPLQKTIDLIKNKNRLQEKVVNFIRNADIYLDNYEYDNDLKINFNPDDAKAQEKALDIPDQVLDQIRLVSTYKGVKVPSIIFDSTGTKKIAALASYIIEGIDEGRTLVVDELDSSIHFKITRAIVAMFNNELNDKAQLIFTAHDVSLLDVNKLFRKEQIWFVHKDSERGYLYSLADFTSRKGVRGNSDVVEKYRKGVLGALPNPELIDSLLDLKGNK